MTNDRGQILIVVAHASEEEAVRRAADAAGCSCEIMVTGVGGAAMSWALQKRIAESGMTGGLVRGVPLRTKTPSGGLYSHLAPGTSQRKKQSGEEPSGRLAPGSLQQAGDTDAPSQNPLTADLQDSGAVADLPLLVIGAGIAGSYREKMVPGTVVTTRSDCFADMGIDDNGRFTSLYSAGLADPDKPPFTGGRIISSGKWFDLAAGLLPPVAGATVNMTSGSEAVIKRIRDAWDPDIETMEGAWLAYTCVMAGIPWIAVRAISNMVEPRNRKKWDIPVALGNLEMKMTRLMELIAPVAQNMKRTD